MRFSVPDRGRRLLLACNDIDGCPRRSNLLLLSLALPRLALDVPDSSSFYLPIILCIFDTFTTPEVCCRNLMPHLRRCPRSSPIR